MATDGCGCAGGLKLLKSKQPPRLTSWLITSSTLHSTGGNLSKLILSSSNDRCDEPIICPTTVADMLSSCWSFNMLSNDIHSWRGKKYKFQVYTCFWKQVINLLYVKNWGKYMKKTDFTRTCKIRIFIFQIIQAKWLMIMVNSIIYRYRLSLIILYNTITVGHIKMTSDHPTITKKQWCFRCDIPVLCKRYRAGWGWNTNTLGNRG